MHDTLPVTARQITVGEGKVSVIKEGWTRRENRDIGEGKRALMKERVQTLEKRWIFQHYVTGNSIMNNFVIHADSIIFFQERKKEAEERSYRLASHDGPKPGVNPEHHRLWFPNQKVTGR